MIRVWNVLLAGSLTVLAVAPASADDDDRRRPPPPPRAVQPAPRYTPPQNAQPRYTPPPQTVQPAPRYAPPQQTVQPPPRVWNEHERHEWREHHDEGRYGGDRYYQGRPVRQARPYYYQDRPYWQGRHFARPRVDVDVYARRYTVLPEFRFYRSWGLAAPLSAYPDLSFLNDAMLVGSYAQDGRTVYIYLIDDEDGMHREFRVDEFGNVLSETIIP